MNTHRGWWSTHPTLLGLCVAGAWDSNGDGIGDLEGIRLHLDDLADMGISGLYLPQVSPFGDDFEWHGLVSQEWYEIDPRYGTMKEFDHLMSECSERDMRVVLTAVPQYVGWHHPDYLAAKRAYDKGLDDPRRDWFLWEDDGTVTTVWSRPGPDLATPPTQSSVGKFQRQPPEPQCCPHRGADCPPGQQCDNGGFSRKILNRCRWIASPTGEGLVLR